MRPWRRCKSTPHDHSAVPRVEIGLPGFISELRIVQTHQARSDPFGLCSRKWPRLKPTILHNTLSVLSVLSHNTRPLDLQALQLLIW